MRTLCRSVVSILGLFVLSSPVYAQNAQVSGALKDQTGAVLPGVTVTAKNVSTGFTRTALSEPDGEYRVPALPPGTYTITAELQGFGSETRPDIVLVIDQHAVIIAALDRSRHADAGHVPGQHPRLLLPRQRQHRRRHTGIFQRLRGRRREQHVGGNGRAAAELRHGCHPGVQGLDLQLQGGIRPGHRRPADGRDQVGDEPAARLGPAVLPRQIDHVAGILPDQQAGLPPLPVRRHARRTDHPRQDPHFRRV